MEREKLNLEETKQMLLYVSTGMIASEPLLSEADRQIGDGDHGVGMARGFSAVKQKLIQGSFTSIAELFIATGTALMMSIGGASGIIFGTLFRNGAANLGDGAELTSGIFAQWLKDGCAAVQDRGKAKPGDKTMLDVLYPAAQAASKSTNKYLTILMKEVSSTAEQGVENTRSMIATVGKAKTLGERSLGYPDPGAISMSLDSEIHAGKRNERLTTRLSTCLFLS